MSIKVEGVSKRFGDSVALKNIDLEIFDGEFFALLGPSGSGKTTLLNIIAGFLDPTQGAVYIQGKDVTDIPPYHRHLGMVFQNYALFPHLNVFSNVAYGLKVQKLSKGEIEKRVHESLSLVQLESFSERMPHQLSGGQQQRVAIARAIATEPSVLLLDEPLSNLDAKLRKNMQTELRLLQKRIGITTVLVTHDQEEALSLSDRIGVLGEGVLQQIGKPIDIYRRPRNRFVAEFIGQINLFNVNEGKTQELNDYTIFEVEDYLIHSNQPFQLLLPNELNDSSIDQIMLRPERIEVSEQPFEERFNIVKVEVVHVNYIGNSMRLLVKLPYKGELEVLVSDTLFAIPPQKGQPLYLKWDAQDLVPLQQEVKQHD